MLKSSTGLKKMTGLKSMTGHGQASVDNEQFEIHVEIRSVNNRFLKLVANSDLSAEFQANIEELIRKSLTRGTLNVRVRFRPKLGDSVYRLNLDALSAYQRQLTEAGWPDRFSLDGLLALPGVVADDAGLIDSEESWAAMAPVVIEALSRLNEMRRVEGRAMEVALLEGVTLLRESVFRIQELAPKIVEAFAVRLTDRINDLLKKFDIQIQQADVVREIGIFSERADIAEELVRLGSHLDLFDATMKQAESSGRKLDFVVQEILRETNTIGSKCSDAEVAGIVVDMKTAIERMRELVQNVE